MAAITVVVPFYQTEKNLFEPCINSILADKDADIELLIVDDGSAEIYHFIADAYLSDSRVKVFHLNHKGVSAARNFGIDKASGTWLMFADSDDYLESGWYSELKPLLSNSEDVILFNGYKDAEGIKKKNQFFVKEGIDYGSSGELRLKVLESAFTIGQLPKGYLSYFSLGSPCSRLFKTCFLKEKHIRFNEEITFAEDTLFALDVIYRARSIIYTDKYLYHYVMHSSSATHRYRQGLSAEMIKFFNAASRFFYDNKVEDRMESAYMNRVFHEMKRAIRLEFFHKDNPKSFIEKHREASRFVRNDPFCSAIKRGVQGEYGTLEKVEAILMKHRMFSLMTETRSILLRNRRIKAFLLSRRTSR